MGNSSSTNVFLAVDDARTGITAGSTLTGELRCPDHSVSGDLYAGVKLFFVGKEDVEVRYKEVLGGVPVLGAKPGGSYKAATRDIVRAVIPLDVSLSRRSEAAQAEGRYPFSFDVPADLPASMHYKDGHGGHASIRYKVKLQLLRGTDQEVPLEIRARPPAPSPVPSVADPMPTRIQFMYCLPQGTVTWAASAENTRVGVGEEVTVNLGLKNDSLARLERVTAKLKQTVEWHSAGHQSKTQTVLRAESFGRTEAMGPLFRGGDGAPAPEGCGAATAYEEVLCTVQGGHNQVTFSIPDHVPQSYAGRLLKIQYYVSVTAKTPSGFTSPKTRIPLDVVAPRTTPPILAAPRCLSSRSPVAVARGDAAPVGVERGHASPDGNEQRDTPPVVIAQAVPLPIVPTAPPMLPDEHSISSASDTKSFSACYAFDADAGGGTGAAAGVTIPDAADGKRLIMGGEE